MAKRMETFGRAIRAIGREYRDSAPYLVLMLLGMGLLVQTLKACVAG
jgi:hypothetical protein